MYKTYLWLAALLLAVPVAAEEMTIDAASLTYDQKAGQAVFVGNVVVKRPDMTLTADRLTGDLQEDSLSTLTATGNVKISRTQGGVTETATGDRGVYTPGSNRLVLTGDVTLTHGAHTLTGNRLDYDIKAGKASVTGQSGVRANISAEE